jgi:hypothetical protein
MGPLGPVIFPQGKTAGELCRSALPFYFFIAVASRMKSAISLLSFW